MLFEVNHLQNFAGEVKIFFYEMSEFIVREMAVIRCCVEANMASTRRVFTILVCPDVVVDDLVERVSLAISWMRGVMLDEGDNSTLGRQIFWHLVHLRGPCRGRRYLA